ncbi:phage tail spike protein [Enterococcus faecium]|uniref:phage tail spike protein n=1 Tax=Enterococcus faecium TaxID=1352 RepID=UPI000F513998|nr:phage tail spike protein [Enterococcus faecium]ROW75885.1 hypothetical protein EGW24_09840 [Enterococcus faecium]
MRYNTSVYFFDEKQQLIRMVTKKYITKNIQTKEITADKSELLNDKLAVTTVYDTRIASAAYMAVKESDGSFSMYDIQNTGDPNNRNEFVGVNFAVKELEGYIVKDVRPQNRTINYVAEQLLNFTNGEWRVGYVKPNLPTITDNFYYLSVKDSLKQLQTHGCEIIFKCKIENRQITDKWIEIYDQIGTASNKRFTYGSSALSIVKEQDRSQIYTSLIGRGKGEEVGDGYGRRIEFSDIEWKTSLGKPVNKPKGQNFVELPEMTAQYGIPLKNGEMRKREGVVVFDDIEDKEQLLLNTYNALLEICRPLVQFKTEILSGDEIGNTVQVHRYDRGYHYRVRVFSVTIDRLTGKVTSNVGDNLAKKSAIKTSSDIQMNIEKLEEEKASFYTSEQVAKWQSDIIRGAKGGAFIMLNQEDLGKGSDRTPFATVWMNNTSIETSDHFLVANSEGIGFIDGDFNLDNFHTAWTIDGVFNAKFIQTGILAGPNFWMDLDSGEAEFAKGRIYGPGLEINMSTGNVTFNKGRLQSLDGKSYIDLNNNDFRLDNGNAVRIDPSSISLYENNVKVSQFDSRGIGIWRGGKAIGYIGTNSKQGAPDIRGLVFDLEYGEGDYMTMAYRENSSATTYTAMLTVDPKGQFYGRKGIYADLDLLINGNQALFVDKVGTSNGSRMMTIESYTVDGSNCIGLIMGGAGVIFGNGNLYVKTFSGLYRWDDWVVNKK